MSVTRIPGTDGLILTGPHIELASWYALRGALRLEALGMRRRGRSVRRIACDRLGLPPGTQTPRVQVALDQRITELEAQMPKEGDPQP